VVRAADRPADISGVGQAERGAAVPADVEDSPCWLTRPVTITVARRGQQAVSARTPDWSLKNRSTLIAHLRDEY
jgi:hypothetical protein